MLPVVDLRATVVPVSVPLAEMLPPAVSVICAFVVVTAPVEMPPFTTDVLRKEPVYWPVLPPPDTTSFGVVLGVATNKVTLPEPDVPPVVLIAPVVIAVPLEA